MVKNKNRKITEDIENIRNLLINEDDDLGDTLSPQFEENFTKTVNYFRNQITNLSEYGKCMRQLGNGTDLAPSFIDSFLEDLAAIKKEFDKSTEGLYNLKEDPKNDFTGYLISLLTRICILNESIKRLHIIRRALENAYDGIDKTEN